MLYKLCTCCLSSGHTQRGGFGETTRVCPCQSVKKSSYPERDQRWLLCCYIVAERMSERAEDDVRGEQRRAARQQLKQQQIQRGEGSTAMATVAERRSLPSPEIMLGQPWSNWVDAAKLHGNDGEFLSVPNVGEEARWSATVSSPVLFLADCMQFLVEYEETLLVATARAGKQVQLFICLCVGSLHF